LNSKSKAGTFRFLVSYFLTASPVIFSRLASVIGLLIPPFAKKLIVKGLSAPATLGHLYAFGVALLLRDEVHEKGQKKVKRKLV
jgi:hypothetical protein